MRTPFRKYHTSLKDLFEAADIAGEKVGRMSLAERTQLKNYALQLRTGPPKTEK